MLYWFKGNRPFTDPHLAFVVSMNGNTWHRDLLSVVRGSRHLRRITEKPGGLLNVMVCRKLINKVPYCHPRDLFFHVVGGWQHNAIHVLWLWCNVSSRILARGSFLFFVLQSDQLLMDKKQQYWGRFFKEVFIVEAAKTSLRKDC